MANKIERIMAEMCMFVVAIDEEVRVDQWHGELGIDDTFLYYAGLHCPSLAFSQLPINF